MNVVALPCSYSSWVSERIRLCDAHHAGCSGGEYAVNSSYFGARINEVVFDSGGHYKHIARPYSRVPIVEHSGIA